MQPKSSTRRRSAASAPVGDARAAVRAQAAVEQREILRQPVDRVVRVGVEAAPHERELPAVRLVEVLVADLAPRTPAARARRARSTRAAPRRPRRAATRRRSRRRARAPRRGSAAVAASRARSSASRDRLGAGVRVAVGVAADPACRSEAAAARPGRCAPVVGEQALGSVDQALLEEPVAVADLVDDARPLRPHLVRLPERRDLVGELVLDLAAARVRRSGSSSSASSAAMRRCAASTVRRAASVGCAVSTSSSETRRAISSRGHVLEPGERVVERLAGARAPRARRRAGGGCGGAARRRSRAGSRARTRAARSPGARAAAPRPLRASSSCGAPPARRARAPRTRSTSSSSDSSSCSTSTRPSRSPSRRTSRRSGRVGRRVVLNGHAAKRRPECAAKPNNRVAGRQRPRASVEAWARRSSTRSGRATSSAAAEGLPDLLYIDLHLVHEVTSPQAFESLRLAGRPVRRPDLTLATMDHNVADRRRHADGPALAAAARRARARTARSSASRSTRPAAGARGSCT